MMDPDVIATFRDCYGETLLAWAEGQESRIDALEKQVRIMAELLEEFVRPIREQREAERELARMAEQRAETMEERAVRLAQELRRDIDLFAPRSKEWDKSAGLDEAEIDDLDVPFPTHSDDPY